MIWVFVLYGLFASVFVIAKVALVYTSPFFLVGSRMTAAGLLMLAYQGYANPSSFKLTRNAWKRLLLLGFFNIYLTNVLELWGLQYLTSFKTCFLYSLTPFFSALFSYLLFSECLTVKKWTGLVIGFVGLTPLFLQHSLTEVAGGQLWMFSAAELTVLAGVITGSYGWIILRQLVASDGCSPFLANGVSMVFGGVCALGHSWAYESWNPIPVTEWVPFLESAFLLMIISNGIAYNLYGFLLKRFSGTFLSFAGFSTAWFTALFGWYFLGEQITWSFFLSAMTVFAGLGLFYQEELQGSMAQPLSPTAPPELSRSETPLFPESQHT